ncbi:hypothetical protein Tsubulata_038859, partial [Turnera subulata]
LNYEVRSLDLSIYYNYILDADQASSSDLDEEAFRDWALEYAVRHVSLRHTLQFSAPVFALSGCATLKTLTLAELDVSGLSFACFPFVTSLRIEHCDFLDFDVTESNFPNLSWFYLSGLTFTGADWFCLSGLRFKGENDGTAPNLQVLEYSDTSGNQEICFLCDFLDINLPSLQRADALVCFGPYYQTEELDEKLMKLFYGVRNAVSLTVCASSLELSWQRLCGASSSSDFVLIAALINLAHLEVSDLSFTWFPALKSLSLEDCDFDGFLHVTDFNFPELAILRLVDVVGSGDIEVSGANVVCLEMEGVGCDKVKLCAPKLQVFVYSDTREGGFWRLSNLYDVDLPSLREAEVSICGAYEEERNTNIWHKLLMGVRNADSIQLHIGELEYWNMEAALLKLQTPPSKFSSLKVTVVNRNRERRSTGSRKVLEDEDMILRYEDEDGAP